MRDLPRPRRPLAVCNRGGLEIGGLGTLSGRSAPTVRGEDGERGRHVFQVARAVFRPDIPAQLQAAGAGVAQEAPIPQPMRPARCAVMHAQTQPSVADAVERTR